MVRRSPGLLIGVLLTIACAVPATALAGPTVSVRVEGLADTLVPRTSITTTDAAVAADSDPAHSCSGLSGAGALDQATGGAWDGVWYDAYGDYIVDRIKGLGPLGAGKYWAIYRNGYATPTGACGTALQQGDSLLFAAVDQNDANGVLDLRGVPARVAPGTTFEVTVRRFATTYEPQPPYASMDTEEPAQNATVSGGGQTVTTGANGTASLSFAVRGLADVRASKAGEVRSASETVCVTDGADGFCGTTKPGDPAAAPAGTPAPAVAADIGVPLGTLGSIEEQQRFARGKAPRELRGAVDGEASGIKDIRLRLTRRDGKRCERYDGGRERWVRMTRCGAQNGTFFSVGDRTPWSYLMPQALTKGRYVLDTQVVDRAGNVTRGATRGKPGEARNRVVFHVG